jgi:predicted enzyme related to lactoylglutathione lyase
MTPKEQQRLSSVVWFEIPANDLERATRFYERILGAALNRQNFEGTAISVFPYAPEAIGGCVLQANGQAPGHGALVYLNADPSLDAVLGRVKEAGGRILAPKTALPGDMGVFARIEDTEGNAVGLHAIL